MEEGARHSGVEHVWPTLIVRERDTPLLYLDQFHWVGLARAAAGSGTSAYRRLLALLHTATATEVLAVPLSSANYMELGGIASHRQRGDVAAVMADLSDFAALPARPAVIDLEVEALLDLLVGPRPVPLQPIPLVGRGWRHAFGVDQSEPPAQSTRDLLEPLRRHRPMPDHEFDAEVAAADEWAERTMLAGPTSDDELEDLRRGGFVQYTAQLGQEKRAEQEQWLSDYMRSGTESRWRRGRLRDVVAARYMKFEAGRALVLGLADRGASVEALPDTREGIRGLVDAMPSADVHVSIQVAIHRNTDSVWKRNDFFDLDALSLAVPYCDVVATERHRANDLRAQGCTGRFRSVVLPSLSELVAYVAETVEK
jgi:hypothetical protein